MIFSYLFSTDFFGKKMVNTTLLTVPTFEVSLYDTKKEKTTSAFFTPREDDKDIVFSLNDGAVKRIFTVSKLIKFSRGIKKKFLPIHLNDYGWVKFLSIHFRSMVKKICNWWKSLKKEKRKIGKTISRPPKYVRHNKHRLTTVSFA